MQLQRVSSIGLNIVEIAFIVMHSNVEGMLMSLYVVGRRSVK